MKACTGEGARAYAEASALEVDSRYIIHANRVSVGVVQIPGVVL